MRLRQEGCDYQLLLGRAPDSGQPGEQTHCLKSVAPMFSVVLLPPGRASKQLMQSSTPALPSPMTPAWMALLPWVVALPSWANCRSASPSPYQSNPCLRSGRPENVPMGQTSHRLDSLLGAPKPATHSQKDLSVLPGGLY